MLNNDAKEKQMRNASEKDIEQIRKTGTVPTSVMFMTPFGLAHKSEDPRVAFKDVDYALLVGASPRGPSEGRINGYPHFWVAFDDLRAVPKKPNTQNKRKKYKRPSGNGFTSKEQFEPYFIYPIGAKVVLANSKKSKLILNDRTCEQAYYCTTEGWTNTNGKSIISPEYDITHVLVTEKAPTTIGFGGYEPTPVIPQEFQLSLTAEELQVVDDILGWLVVGGAENSRRGVCDVVCEKIKDVMEAYDITRSKYEPSDISERSVVAFLDKK